MTQPNEWISMTERWPVEGWKVTVKAGNREEIAVRYGKTWVFADKDRILPNPVKEQITHWKPGRWLKEKTTEKETTMQHNEQTQTQNNVYPLKKPKRINLSGMKCQCGSPSFLHITSIMPNNQVNIACQRYLYSSGDDGCSGFIWEGEIHWRAQEEPKGETPMIAGAYCK